MKIKRLLVKLIKEYLYRRTYIAPRECYANNDLKAKLNSPAIKPIDEEQKRRITDFWGKYSVKFNMGWFDFFNTIAPNATHLEYYIPHDLYYCKLDPYFSNIQLSRVFDNKNMYDLYFHDVPQPKTLVRIVNGFIQDNNYQFIDIEKAISLCEANSHIIIKPSIDSEGGAGIRFWNNKTNSREELEALLTDGGNYIFQSVVNQCNQLAQIHPNSLNTIRIITLIHNNEVIPLSSILRMGRGGASVDNAASGGCYCGINHDGTLKDIAYDSLGNKYAEHPQGGILSKYKIPNFYKCVDMVKFLAPRLSHISKLCSWDICVDSNDMPLLIEVNLSYGDVQLHQITNGPIFGDMTATILNEVFSNNRL